MPPSCQHAVPPWMNDGSEFPVMNAFSLQNILAPHLAQAADPPTVQNLAQDLVSLGVIPVNLANGIAEGLIVGIRSALALGRRRN